jgi:hypothetical protein
MKELAQGERQKRPRAYAAAQEAKGGKGSAKAAHTAVWKFYLPILLIN